MSSSRTSGPARTLPIYTTALAWFFVVACAAMAIVIPVTDPANSELLGTVAYVVAAVLVAAGVVMLRRGSPRLAVALVTAGAVLGGIFLVWTLRAPILALVLIVLFAWGALRDSTAALQPAA
jgi:hypothetical protein